MFSGSELFAPLAVFAGGFAVSILSAFSVRGRNSLLPLGLGAAAGATAVLWALWIAVRQGWVWFGVVLLGSLGALVAAGMLFIAICGAIESWQRTLWFRRHRAALEALIGEPEADVHDPELRAGGVYSFERENGCVFFAAGVSEDNGRTPDLLHGFLHAPEGPPPVGCVLPRSKGRHREGASPFRLVRVERVGGPWWQYTAEEVWARSN